MSARESCMSLSGFIGLERAASGLADGRLVREGGVIRDCASGRVVELLQDQAHSGQGILDDMEECLVPLAAGSSALSHLMGRLERIQRTEHSVPGHERTLGDEIGPAAALMEGLAFGKLWGTVHACHLEQLEGRKDRMAGYRQLFLETFHRTRQLADDLSRSPEALENNPLLIQGSYRVMVIGGLAAREVSTWLGESCSGLEISRLLAAASRQVTEAITGYLEHCTALFWREPVHLLCQAEIQESDLRLHGHTEQLKLAWQSSRGLVVRRRLGIPEPTDTRPADQPNRIPCPVDRI